MKIDQSTHENYNNDNNNNNSTTTTTTPSTTVVTSNRDLDFERIEIARLEKMKRLRQRVKLLTSSHQNSIDTAFTTPSKATNFDIFSSTKKSSNYESTSSILASTTDIAPTSTSSSSSSPLSSVVQDVVIKEHLRQQDEISELFKSFTPSMKTNNHQQHQQERDGETVANDRINSCNSIIKKDHDVETIIDEGMIIIISSSIINIFLSDKICFSLLLLLMMIMRV
jgi:hypothetical protein